MNLHLFVARLLGLALTAAFPLAAVADSAKPPVPVSPPSEEQMRATLTKGLAFLAKEGDTWIADKNCNSCHHIPELLWSHREAKLRGFAVDDKKFDEWLKWSLERAADKKPGLEEAAFMILALPDRSAPELTKLLANEQKPDGSWNPAGQFSSMQKRGAPDALANSTRVNLLALGVATPTAPEADAARSKAAPVLQKKEAPTATESIVFRILFARRYGDPKEAGTLCLQLAKQQRGDGGWSSFIGENMSDPLATGEVLYALQTSAADPKVADAIAKGQNWLVRTQLPDGSWQTDITHVGRMDRSAPEKAKSFKAATEIYHYWGTGWATIGLLQGVPLKK